jgi:phospholipid/cholesterol/gamma-HCH transport system ATP-binding protein
VTETEEQFRPAVKDPDPGIATTHLAFDDVHMAFESRHVFRGLSCRFPAGKISVILGGSGSGKSTLLRLAGGLIRPQGGRITVDGEEITGLSERRMYRIRNKLGMLFQGGALLDSMTVFDNLAFPLREHTRLDAAQITQEVHGRLASVGLEDVDELLPGQLSGGMTKRVALARAIMMKPVILFCDEPFSGLDPLSTRRIESLLVEINRRFGITMVVVSHHIPSTMRMAAHVLLLLPDGAIDGSPQELLRGDNPAVRTFLSDNVEESVAFDFPLPAEKYPEGNARSA